MKQISLLFSAESPIRICSLVVHFNLMKSLLCCFADCMFEEQSSATRGTFKFSSFSVFFSIQTLMLRLWLEILVFSCCILKLFGFEYFIYRFWISTKISMKVCEFARTDGFSLSLVMLIVFLELH